MKNTMMMVLGTMLALGAGAGADTASEERAQKVAGLYQQGVSALEEGNGKLAAECFREVLSLQPSHGNARYQLLSLEQRRPALAAKVRQRKLAQIRIPKVQFEEVSFEEAIKALDVLIEQETKGEFAPNFVIQDPHRQLEEKKVSMRLGAVPANVVLEYILKMANAKVRYDEHAIVLSPVARPPSGGGQAKGTGLLDR